MPGTVPRTPLLLVAALAAAPAACGCTRVFAPTAPRTASAQGAEVEVRRVTVVTNAAAVPESPLNVVDVEARYRTDPGVALAFARVAPAGAQPCTTGAVAATEVRASAPRPPFGEPRPGDAGTLTLVVPRALVDRETRLGWDPASLDVTVLHADGTPTGCLRVPLVEATGGVEWEQPATRSAGVGFAVAVPVRTLYSVEATAVFLLRWGGWLGPVRLRVEGMFGGAPAQTPNPNLEGYAYGGGVLADVLLLHSGLFGLGLAAGYDALGISFGAQVDALSHTGAGFQGVLHGPRGGLVLALLPPPAPGRAFHGRPDAGSMSLEVYAAELWTGDMTASAPAVWAGLHFDGGY